MGEVIINGSRSPGTPWEIESGLGLVKQIGDNGPVGNPLGRFQAADRDQSTPTLRYFSFTDITGSWYIQRSSGANSTIMQEGYIAGGSSYTGSWAARASITYDRFYNVF